MDFSTPPPPRGPLILDTITALGDLSVSSRSYFEDSDVDMHDADWEGLSEDEMLYDAPCLPSIETDDPPYLRGGILMPPPNLHWARKPSVAGRQDQGDDDDDQDDDGYSASSDWDEYDGLSPALDEYDDIVTRLEGSEDWNAEQRKLHKLIYMRGLHPMMHSWWRVSFKMWGVTQPHLDDVFTPKNSQKRVAIHAYGNEVAAAKALESLFYLSQTVTDYEEIGYQSKIAMTVVKGIRGYIKWALRDAGIDQHRTQPCMLVQAYPPDFRGADDDDDDSDGSDFAPSPVSAKSNEEDGAPKTTIAAAVDKKLDPEYLEAQRARRFTRAVSRDLERRLLDMGQRWRDLLRAGKKSKRFVAPPPTLYAFAVVQHIVMLASHDPGAATNPVVVLEQVRLNDRGQWLWNALSIALPVNMARDALNGMWETGVVVEERRDSESDPDL
ncbi:hypothetical protein C8A05DRAFT_14060 [Staphylotrichum tortipilum]|uniref:Uncharacterized protein n=1 Tax=Staphylotrichum tortipilum TaxID=2831512 RepID=A0AAN6RUM0_9PEZI|nr:hypothetical protein C8A05DRAFT_14060 [Staphylotrichum longicolle]